MHWRQRSGAGNALEGFGPVTLADTRCGQCNGGRDQVRAMHWGQRSGRCGKCTGGRDQVQVLHWVWTCDTRRDHVQTRDG